MGGRTIGPRGWDTAPSAVTSFGKTNDEATNTHELNPDRVTVCDWPDPVHAGHVRVCIRLRPFSRDVAICQASPQCRPIHRLADVSLSSLYFDGNAASGSAYTNKMASGKLPRMRNPNLLTTDAHELATVHVGRMDVPEMWLRDGRLRKETLDSRTRRHTQHPCAFGSGGWWSLTLGSHR